MVVSTLLCRESDARGVVSFESYAFNKLAKMSEIENDVTQLQVLFVTKQQQYAIPDTPYAIGANVSTNELNTLVNTVLKENPAFVKDVNFDFLVCGEFLRTSLLEHLSSHQVTTESTIDVEYLERVPAPKPHDCLTHDDWVAAVRCLSSWIVTGCYDNSLHLWDTKGNHKLAIPGHTSPVKAVSWVRIEGSTGVFISGSHDQTAMIWEWDINSNSVECVVSCKGHDKSIDCIDVTSDGSRFATGSWDTNIKLWSAELSDEGASSNKKSKVDSGKPRSAQLNLAGHREAVSGVKWLNDDSELVSASWDHTLKIWDVELAAPSRTIASNKPFFSLDLNPINKMLITSSADKIVRIFDQRLNVDAPVVNAKGHSAWVSAVKWSPSDENLFISAGHDMALKMWDVRSPRAALYEMSGHTDKLLCCDWFGRFLISGGADNAMRVYKARKPAC